MNLCRAAKIVTDSGSSVNRLALLSNNVLSAELTTYLLAILLVQIYL